MGTKTAGSRPAALLIRRFVAVVLTLLSVGALFWPSAIALGGTLRVETKEEIRNIEKELDDYRDDSDEGKYARAAYYLVLDTIRGYQKTTDKDAKKAAKEAENIFRSITDINYMSEGVVYSMLSTVYGAIKDLGLSYEEIREVISKLPYFASKAQEVWPQDAEPYKGLIDGVRYGAIGWNALFFLMLALAAAAVVMMILNRSKVFSILYAIFAVLLGGAFIALWIFLLVKGVHVMMPGVAAFLLPILAIAACIVYKRDKSYRGVFPKRQKKPAPVPAPAPEVVNPGREERAFEDEQAFVHSYRPAAEPAAAYAPVEAGWLCPVCGERVNETARFCTKCGTPKAAPAPEPAPEPEPEEPTVAFEPEPEPAFEEPTVVFEPEPEPEEPTVAFKPEPEPEPAFEEEPLFAEAEEVAAKADEIAAEADEIAAEADEIAAEAEQAFDEEPLFAAPEPAPEPTVRAPKFCTKCGNPTSPGTKFCTKCGNKLI